MGEGDLIDFRGPQNKNVLMRFDLFFFCFLCLVYITEYFRCLHETIEYFFVVCWFMMSKFSAVTRASRGVLNKKRKTRTKKKHPAGVELTGVYEKCTLRCIFIQFRCFDGKVGSHAASWNVHGTGHVHKHGPDLCGREHHSAPARAEQALCVA